MVKETSVAVLLAKAAIIININFQFYARKFYFFDVVPILSDLHWRVIRFWKIIFRSFVGVILDLVVVVVAAVLGAVVVLMVLQDNQ